MWKMGDNNNTYFLGYLEGWIDRMHAKHITHRKNSTTILQYLIPGLEVECFLLKRYKNNTSDHLKDSTHYTGTMISDPIVGDGVKHEDSFDLP